MDADIWAYDPMTNTWTQSAANLGLARGYIATETMPDGLIYLAGGSQYNGGNLTDETIFEKFNPATNTIAAGPGVPVATSNNHGYNVGGKFTVVSGGFTTSVTTVQVFDPAANAWSAGPDTLFPVRNYAKGYGLNGAIHAIGGTADSAAAQYYDYNQRLTPGGACGSPTPSPTTPPSVTRTPTGTPPATTTAPAATATRTSIAPTSTATRTGVAPTGTATRTATATETPCNITFTDVHPSDYFYEPVRYLYCHGVISGYADNTFRPYNNTTRSQMVKIVVLGFAIAPYTPPAGGYTFTDVPPSNPFFSYIETAAHNNIVSGYTCGTVQGEPCDAQNRPYFRPYAYVTRGQLAKIDVVGAGWTLIDPATQSFADVYPNTAFYTFVETAYCHGIISGYSCGGPGEPCDSQNRPYYRQFNDATRGQIAKIVYGSIMSPASCGITASR
jgi:hypothetical protein